MAIIFNLNQRYSGELPDGYHDTSQVTAAAGDIKSGKKIVDAAGEIINGSMPVNGTTGGTISAKDTTVNIPAGHTTGGSVSISSTEQAKIIAGNIKSGVTILGQAGSSTVVDTSTGTANEAQLLMGKKAWVDGEELTGTMPNIGTQIATISTKSETVVPTKGYHSGAGSVSISSTEQAKIIADNIKQGVTILGVDGSAGVPSGYHDTSQVTAAAGDVITGKKIVNASGAVVNGTMLNNGAVSGSINGMVASSYNVPAGYHNGSGSVTLTGDIETALAAI